MSDCEIEGHTYIYTHEGNAHHTIYHYHENDCPFCVIEQLAAAIKVAEDGLLHVVNIWDCTCDTTITGPM